jgi:hypothetical protein
MNKNEKTVRFINYYHKIIHYLIFNRFIYLLNQGIEPPQECFLDIRLHGRWNSKRVIKEGFVSKLSNEHPMQRNLYNAYRTYHKRESAISFKTIEYFDAISYTVLQDGANIDIRIRVGDAIDVEDDDEMQSRAFAVVRGIFTHMANDKKKYAFFIIDWYYETGRVENFTGSKIYGLQESDDDLWTHIHSFHIVDRRPRVHFVHNCKTSCVDNHHSTNNTEYLHNEFFYMAV